MPKWPTSSRKRRSKVKIASSRSSTPAPKKREVALWDDTEEKGLSTQSPEHDLTIAEKPKKRIWRSKKSKRKNGFNFDILLAGIALGCVLGSVLFYFQGLQPLILDNIITLNNTQADELYDDFINKTTSMSQLSQTLDTAYSRSENEVCTGDISYTNRESDLATLDQLERQLIPNLNVRDPLPFNSFEDQDVFDLYNNVYSEYTTILDTYSEISASFRESVAFLEYRNIWIETCGDLLSNQTDAFLTEEEITTSFCERVGPFEANINPETTDFDNLQPILETSQTLCQDQENETDEEELPLSVVQDDDESEEFVWREVFLQGYGDITTLPSQHQAVLVQAESSVNRLERVINSYSIEVKKTQNEKTSLTGMWYIVSFNGL